MYEIKGFKGLRLMAYLLRPMVSITANVSPGNSGQFNSSKTMTEPLWLPFPSITLNKPSLDNINQSQNRPMQQ